MSSNNNSSGAGIGFLGLLTIAFIVLKLTKCIAWSWWWVLAPMWMSLALVLLDVTDNLPVHIVLGPDFVIEVRAVERRLEDRSVGHA